MKKDMRRSRRIAILITVSILVLGFMAPISKAQEKVTSPEEFFGFQLGSDKKIARYSEKLRTALEKKGISYSGNFRYLGYNPPYQFIGRKNEIIVSVNWPE